MTVLSQKQASLHAAGSRIAAEIKLTGFSGPLPLLSSDTCEVLHRHLERTDLPAPLSWAKGRAATDPVLYEFAVRPDIIALLQPLLGEDIILWGVNVLHRTPGESHPWHTDMECADPDSRAISVWIGIRNTSQSSGLRFIAGSHRFGHPVQEVLAGLNESREAMGDERMLTIAQTIDAAAQLMQPGAQDGEAVLFDGRIWHSGYNARASGTRTALLLQYASAEMAIPMPGPGYGWPFTFKDQPRVPTILVSGKARHSPNRLVPAPSRRPQDAPMITTVAKTLELPLADDPVKRWRAYPQFRGVTGALSTMSCHISVLSPGHHPHPPHIHPEEELLIVIDGQVEIELADAPDGTGSTRHPLRPGMFSYYPATQHHTIHNTADRPATYLMFKWRGDVVDTETPLRARVFEYEDAVVTPEPRPRAHKILFEHPTHTLSKLHCHLTTLQPGAGYSAHIDPYDVAIVLLSGEIETINTRVRPLGLVYYSAGELHGMRNVGAGTATYLVFEFHGPRRPEPPKPKKAKKKKRGIRKVFRKFFKLAKKPKS